MSPPQAQPTQGQQRQMGVVGCLMQDMHQENHANTKTASLRAQPEWLKGLLSYFQHQIKKAEVSSRAGSAPAAGPLSGKSGAQNTVSGTKGTGLGTPAGPIGSQNNAQAQRQGGGLGTSGAMHVAC